MINIKIESTAKKDNEAAQLIAQAITYMLKNDEIDCGVTSKHDSYFGDDVIYGCGHDYYLDDKPHADEIKQFFHAFTINNQIVKGGQNSNFPSSEPQRELADNVWSGVIAFSFDIDFQ